MCSFVVVIMLFPERPIVRIAILYKVNLVNMSVVMVEFEQDVHHVKLFSMYVFDQVYYLC